MNKRVTPPHDKKNDRTNRRAERPQARGKTTDSDKIWGASELNRDKPTRETYDLPPLPTSKHPPAYPVIIRTNVWKDMTPVSSSPFPTLQIYVPSDNRTITKNTPSLSNHGAASAVPDSFLADDLAEVSAQQAPRHACRHDRNRGRTHPPCRGASRQRQRLERRAA